MPLTEMDMVRAAIANAMVEGVTLADLWACAEHAVTVDDLEEAVNLLAHMQARDTIADV